MDHIPVYADLFAGLEPVPVRDSALQIISRIDAFNLEDTCCGTNLR